MRSEEDGHTVSRMPIPANNAVAGGNGCRIPIRGEVGQYILFDALLDQLSR